MSSPLSYINIWPIYHPDGTLYGVIGLDVTVSVLENVVVASSIS